MPPSPVAFLAPFTPRFLALTLSGFGLLGLSTLATVPGCGGAAPPAAICGGLVLLGTYDLWQREHAVLRCYPILGHLRFLSEKIRPEIRQYFFENDTDGRPFSRDKRAVVYQRAKMNIDTRPFGTLADVYEEGYEWLRHSTMGRPIANADFRLRVGGHACAKPYDMSVLNISAMSFGALSANAIRALNAGAQKGGFAHDTGEGGVSPYHREFGGDLIWEIGSGYFGCRGRNGSSIQCGSLPLPQIRRSK